MIVITAPTSKIGRQVLANILGKGEPIRVIARDPSALPRETQQHVEVVRGSHRDSSVVTEAFRGADTVFWLVPADPRAESAHAAYVDFAQAGCEAFRTEGITRVVGISSLGRGWPEDAGHATATLAMDDLIASTGVSYRALACAEFMENVLRQLGPIKTEGVFSAPNDKDLKIPVCATRDIAAVASKLLLDPTWTGVESLPLRGPEDISFGDIADIISDVLGKPVRYEQMSLDDLRAMALNRGMSSGMAEAVVNMYAAKNKGLDKIEPRTSGSTTPTSFRQWCEDVLKPAVLA